MEEQTTVIEATEKRRFPPTKPYIPPNKTAAVFNGIKNFFGIAVLLLGAWTAFLTAFIIGPNMVTLKYVDGYQPATFTIQRLNFTKGDIRGNRHTHDTYWADGIVNGHQEKFFLGDYIKGVINSQAELEKQIHVGQQLKVLYNPGVPKNKFEKKRVVYPEKDFKNYWIGFQQRRLQESYCPLGVSILLCLVFGIAARNIVGAIGFVVGSAVMVLIALTPMVLNLIF